ncbi:MAG TPA: carbonic anhydrase family protein [Terracidiphilus sp.]|jgi:carbonic anhydrase
MRFPAALAVLALGMATLSAVQSAAQIFDQNAAPWDYQGKRGELVWGKLDPAYQACNKGHEQSPIDIRGAHLNKSLQPIEFHYIAGPVTLTNDGHTIVARVDPGSYIVAGGVRYELIQFDFHHPSEEAVKGKFTDMDVQLLHRSNDGRLAIVTVRLIEDVSSSNAVLAMLWPHLPRKAGASEKVQEMVNAAGFLPVDRGYWTYMGSLSTPPCTEGVRWFVFVQELSVSRAQLRAFVALFRMNTRGLQDTHGRRIEANE